MRNSQPENVLFVSLLFDTEQICRQHAWIFRFYVNFDFILSAEYKKYGSGATLDTLAKKKLKFTKIWKDASFFNS